MAGTAVLPRVVAALSVAVALALPAAASAADPGSAQALENQGVTQVIVKRDAGLSAAEQALRAFLRAYRPAARRAA